MRDFGLEDSSFDKLLQVLVERKLLDPSEAESLSGTRAGHSLAVPSSVGGAPPSGETSKMRATPEKDPESICPQCGAEVGRRTLLCPECGHVLPGEERWQSLDQEKGLLSRVPRRAIGWALALPAAVAIFFTVKNVMIPLTRLNADKKIEDARKTVSPNSLASTRDTAAEAVSTEAIEQEVAALIAEGMLSAASQDKITFITGAIWEALGQEERSEIIVRLQEAFRASGLTPVFELVDPFGKTVVKVNDTSTEFVVSEESARSTSAENKVPPALEPPQDLEDQIRKSIPSQLPPRSSPSGVERE